MTTITKIRVAVLSSIYIAVAAMTSVSLHAQATTATILGTVNDSSGATVPGATVTVTNTTTGIGQTAVSDSRGRYVVPTLAVGTYSVKAELQGFQTVIQQG